MISVGGIYDGKHIYSVDAIKETRKYKVIITFVEEINTTDTEDLSLRNFGTTNASLDFWNETHEDIYQDFLPNSRK